MEQPFHLDITTIDGADVSGMDTYAEVIENSGLVVRSSLRAKGVILSGWLTDTAVETDIYTVLSDHVKGIRPVHVA